MLHLASMSKSEDKMNGKLWNLLDTNAALFVGKKKKTFANAMASQPAKLNNTENQIACITISTGI